MDVILILPWHTVGMRCPKSNSLLVVGAFPNVSLGSATLPVSINLKTVPVRLDLVLKLFHLLLPLLARNHRASVIGKNRTGNQESQTWIMNVLKYLQLSAYCILRACGVK